MLMIMMYTCRTNPCNINHDIFHSFCSLTDFELWYRLICIVLRIVLLSHCKTRWLPLHEKLEGGRYTQRESKIKN